MNKKYFLTFGNKNFNKQLERLKKESESVGWFDGTIIETPETIQSFYKKHRFFIDANERGYGYWIWKPYVILRQLREMEDGDMLFYTDAGATILPHRKKRFDEYVQLLNQSEKPIITFCVPGYTERNLQKPASLRKFKRNGLSLEHDEAFLESGQIESGVFLCKKNKFTVDFVQSWLDNLLENDYELAHDFDCKEYRHDQSVLSILCKIHETTILYAIDVYGMGPFFSSRMVDAGQRTKGPDLYRSQIGYDIENPKHDSWANWLTDTDYLHYFSVQNVGFFVGKFDSETKILKETVMISDYRPWRDYNSTEIDKKDLWTTAENYVKSLPLTNNETNLDNLRKSAIPVIGTAVVNSTSWLKRLIASVDYPVNNFVIVNNNGRGELTEELELICKKPHPYIQKMHLVHMPTNIGVAASWNLFIKWFMNSPYWLIVNDDCAFCAGLLEEFHNTAQDNPDTGIIHAYQGDGDAGSWDLFLIRDFIISKYGLFDENLYPAYSEDIDYLMRFKNDSINRIMNLSKNYYHGDGLKGEYYMHGSQTTKTEPFLLSLIDNSKRLNAEYIKDKWGCDWNWASHTPNTLAFNKYPVNYNAYDLDFVRKKYLGF